MERLIADLLESERMNVGHTTLQRTLVDLCAMLTGLISDEFQEQSARIELKLPPGVVVREVDEVRHAPGRQEPDRERPALHAARCRAVSKSS